MNTAIDRFVDFATGLQFEDIPPEVIERAKDCVIDTVGACVFGAELPWTKIVIGYAQRNSAPGESSVFGTAIKVRAPFACLANGSAAHAFELDTLFEPSVGAHPGAALAVPGIAVSQGRRRSGKDFLTAVVAGYEVLHRLGDAAHHSIEKVGFHSPAVIGVFGTVVTVGRLFALDASQLANAFGIAGSLSSGLMEFSLTGGMVKRLHLGRAAEGGFMAAVLARDGYTGPTGILEGKFGIYNVFCRDAETARLTMDLGSVWRVMKTKIKRFACHATAQIPVTLVLDLKGKHRISGDDVAQIKIEANARTVRQHSIPEPKDVAMAQYSVQFCAALGLYLDPADPRAFSQTSLNDPRIRALTREAQVGRIEGSGSDVSPACRVTLRLKDGREVSAEGDDFKGTPTMPLTRSELREKFRKLTAHRDKEKAERLFMQLAEAEKIEDFSALDFAM